MLLLFWERGSEDIIAYVSEDKLMKYITIFYLLDNPTTDSGVEFGNSSDAFKCDSLKLLLVVLCVILWIY